MKLQFLNLLFSSRHHGVSMTVYVLAYGFQTKKRIDQISQHLSQPGIVFKKLMNSNAKYDSTALKSKSGLFYYL